MGLINHVNGIKVNASFPGGETLAQFSKLINTRIKWLKEGARNSVAACGIQALRSIRASTRVASITNIRPNVKVDDSLYVSVKTVGHTKDTRGSKTWCIRNKSSNSEFIDKTYKIRKPNRITKHTKVYKYDDYDDSGLLLDKYIILADSLPIAKNIAKNIEVQRIIRYRGLAKTTLTVLMKKMLTIKDAVQYSQRVNMFAEKMAVKNEKISETDSGGNYHLEFFDNLRYALLALKGGQGEVDRCLKNAMNSITAVINKKCEKFISFDKLPTPFPEVAHRRGR